MLTWDGDVSAISRDAMEDVRHAKSDTVIDEWDEDFDRGKVRRAKTTKKYLCFCGVFFLVLPHFKPFFYFVFIKPTQVKKVKNYKRESWRSGSSIFQKIQDRRNKWSVTPGGKRVFGVRR